MAFISSFFKNYEVVQLLLFLALVFFIFVIGQATGAYKKSKYLFRSLCVILPKKRFSS